MSRFARINKSNVVNFTNNSFLDTKINDAGLSIL